MKFTEMHSAGIPQLELQGKVFSGSECQPLIERITALTETGATDIILDFSKLGYINSTGIGSILSCVRTIKDRGGKLYFVALPHKIAYYFRVTKLDTVLEIAGSTDEALQRIRALKQDNEIPC
jgi:anti-sigma B factor antagonist